MLGFIAAIIAGVVTPQLDAPVARPLSRLVGPHITLEANETRLISFMVAMIAASVIAVLLDSGSTFWVMVGGVLGYFGTRLVKAARAAFEARRDS